MRIKDLISSMKDNTVVKVFENDGEPVGVYMPAAKRGERALLEPDKAPTVSDLKRRKIKRVWTEKDDTGLSLDGAMLHILMV